MAASPFFNINYVPPVIHANPPLGLSLSLYLSLHTDIHDHFLQSLHSPFLDPPGHQNVFLSDVPSPLPLGS